jgi:hypothetical protein
MVDLTEALLVFLSGDLKSHQMVDRKEALLVDLSGALMARPTGHR